MVNIHGAQRMNPNDFSDLTFQLEPPAGQTFQLSSEICQRLQDGLAQVLIDINCQSLLTLMVP